MDDKARIRALKFLLGGTIAGSMFNLMIIVKQYNTIIQLSKTAARRNEKLVDANRYIRKIFAVCEPTPENMVAINEGFDFEKWGDSLSFSEED